MKRADDAYTIMIFRGIADNPLKVRVNKRFAKGAAIVVAVLMVVQTWGTVNYVVQTERVEELASLRQEMNQSRGRMLAVSDTVTDIKRRMTTLQELSRKLQTMFGLEFEPDGDAGVRGRGGEEVPDADAPDGDTGASVDEAASRAEAGPGGTADPPMLTTALRKDLAWLDRRVSRQQYIFGQLEDTATKRVERWDATPSIWPVKGSITSRFGPRLSPFTGKKTLHSGVDIGAKTGKRVLAPANGRVVKSAYDSRMGHIVRLHHGYGIETTYGHLSKRLVKRGQRVKRGDALGLVGSTGRFSTGPHLHYQVAVNDKIVNPLQYILD